MAITEVAAGVYELRLPIPFEDGLVNVYLFADGRRIALTPQQVVILTLHPGNLDLESAMSARLNTWRFTV